MVATNKQMVDLTYLCFVFLNDRSDAWWEMQWAACQGRDNSRERARESCIHPQFVPISAVFKVSNFFFALLLAVARAAVPQPPSLPNYHPHTDRQAADGETRCVHEENQFGDETNVLHQGGIRFGPGGGEGKVQVHTRAGTSLDCGRLVTVSLTGWWFYPESDPSRIYLPNYLFIYLFCSLDTCCSCRFQTGSLPKLEIKALKNHSYIFDIQMKVLWVDRIIGTSVKYKFCDNAICLIVLIIQLYLLYNIHYITF